MMVSGGEKSWSNKYSFLWGSLQYQSFLELDKSLDFTQVDFDTEVKLRAVEGDPV